MIVDIHTHFLNVQTDCGDQWILENSRYRGSQVGVEHAEGFCPMLSRGFVKAYPVLP